jgi:transcriptional regulator with XRE-family HTH domain
MTLKDLRIAKGLSQVECAKYLGMSVRNYQNYESGKIKATSAKYNAIYQKLEAYGSISSPAVDIEFNEYKTNVVTGAGLQDLVRGVAKYQKRDCFALLQRFITTPIDGKIGTLYGLRRTGKTTLLFQMISELPVEKTAYIKIKTSDNMSMLTKDLRVLHNKGCK